jgi:PIN domain nuclease of toxin-antitoxin system
VLWLAEDYQRITSRAQAAIRQARNRDRGIAISCISLLEIARLASFGRLALKPDTETVLCEIERVCIVLPISANIALQAYDLPSNYPKDPSDRIIGATALIEDIPLITADREIQKSRAIATIW